MKFITAFVIALAGFVLLPNGIAAQEQKASTNWLGWMAGCWELNARDGALIISEQWMKPAGGTLIGMSRTVSGGKTVAHEFVRIVTDAEGISYIAKPSSNKDETVFRLSKFSPDELVFENLTHDFPQRIIYRNVSLNAMSARIEGTKNGKLSGTDFPMKRVQCETIAIRLP